MIIQKGTMLALTIIMLASSVAAAEDEFIIFKNGHAESAKVVNCTRAGITVVAHDKKKHSQYLFILTRRSFKKNTNNQSFIDTV